MTEEKWRKALDLYLAPAEVPPERREALLASSSIDSKGMERLIDALEEAESRSKGSLPGTRHDPDSGRIGMRVSHYVVTAWLGRGGMGEVFSAQDTELGRTVALKFLLAAGLESIAAVERFI